MTTLRWILGSLLVIAAGGFIFLSVVGRGFRKSFGASDVNPQITLAPLVGMGLLLGALIFPTNRILLHAAAAVAVALIGVCLWQMVSDGATFLGFVVVYLAAWLIFYWQSTWGGSLRG